MTASARPILFSGPMVRALIEGRKTKTRRLMKEQEALSIAYAPIIDGRTVYNYAGEEVIDRARYGVGDLLYVREHWRTIPQSNDRAPRDLLPGSYVEYAATDGEPTGSMTGARFRQGMHMPRWASRLTLEVTGVKVERLQEISETDARSEGIADGGCVNCGCAEPCGCKAPSPDPIDSFARLWDDLNEKRGFGWGANPWVVAVTFTIHHMNVDAFILQRRVA